MGLEAESPDLENSGLDRYGLIANSRRLNRSWMKEARGLTNVDGGWFTRIELLQVVACLYIPR